MCFTVSFFAFLKLGDNCFTVLCWFLPYNSMNQAQVYIYPFPLDSWTSDPHPAPHPAAPPQVVTEHQVELPVLHSTFPLAVCFTYGNVHGSVLLSVITPSSPFPAVSTSLFSVCVSRLFNTLKIFLKYKTNPC